MNADDRAALDHLRKSLGGWALGDVKKAADAGVKVGAFILAANLIDVLARLAFSKPKDSDAKAAWDEFVAAYLGRYDGYAEELYRGFRSAVSHNYSLDGIRLVDGPNYVARHWQVEEHERVLHLETFISDLEAAFERFYTEAEHDPALRERVLRRTAKRPLLGIVGGYEGVPAASAASSTAYPGATHFGLPDGKFEEPSVPRMIAPKGRKPKRT